VSRLCCAELHIADSYGDNNAAIRCQLPEGHEGPHREEFLRGGKSVVITYEVDEFEEERRRDLERIAELEKEMGMSADEFLRKLEAGEIDPDGELKHGRSIGSMEWLITDRRESDIVHEKRKSGETTP
jgi:hypothetical protein